ncbi:hypothetical protein J2X43_003724 [Rhizobium sp. BE258]|nr:hypothetical protein [Rhizobium sp. BE258]MDR7145515.1 hypothetical protein [Rhizobium sp. BE258]
MAIAIHAQFTMIAVFQGPTIQNSKRSGVLRVLAGNCKTTAVPCFVSHDEVDFADASENHFLEMRPIAFIGGRRRFENQVVGRWIEEREELRIVQENIDVMAFAMVDLQHHCSTAAEGPIGHQHMGSIYVIDELVGNRKKLVPTGCHAARA